MTIRTALKLATAPIGLCAALAAHPLLAQDETATEVLVTDITDEDEEPEVGATGRPAAPGTQIVVTGSRIRRDAFTAPAPLTVVDPQTAARQGLLDTAEMIQGSPIAAGSSQVTAAISTNFLTNGGTGAQTISLRGLGAERTLVLLNGRRAGPAGTRGGVASFDLNVLPQSIVERVDLLKDGASSIYGSDAVAGVVNLITKTDTDGVEFDFFGSVPQREGGEQWSASATWGKTFDRGHILVSANYWRRNELARGDRSYLRCPENYIFTDESLDERADLIDPRTGDYVCDGHSGVTWGHVWTYDYSYYDYDDPPDGLANTGSPFGSNIPASTGGGEATRFQFSYGNDNLGQYIPALAPRMGATAIPGFPGAGQIAVPAGWFPVGYDMASAAVDNNYHPFMDNDTVTPETNRYTVYLDAAYELTDGIEFYTELLFNKRDNFVNASGQIYQFGYGEVYDYYYDYSGDGLQTTDPVDGFPFDPYAQGWYGPATFSPTPFNPHVDSEIEVEYYRAVAGFRGGLFDSWGYDLYGQWSRSDGTYRNQTALKDAIACGNFRSGTKGYSNSNCPGGVTPVSGRQNVIVDWFSPRFNYGDYTLDEYNFLFAWDEGNTKYTQKYLEAIVTGDLIDLWAGPVGIALGATIREDDINDVPGPIRQADNGSNFGGAGVTAGKAVTKEAFGEIRIPVLEDFPLVRSFEVSAAGRVTNVTATRASDGLEDSDDGNWTYKLSANWEVAEFLRLRGTYGTSFRAPALFELFLADQTGFLAQRSVDPCIQWGINLAQGNISQRFADNCAADGVSATHTGAGVNLATLSGGGIGELDPETSRAWTASVILTPSFGFLPNTDISLAIDYFDIEVNGEIAQLGAGNVLFSCYASDFFPNDPLCDQFFRFQDLVPGTPLYDQYFQTGNAENVAVVFDSFFNVNSQQNRGVDVTARIIHDFPGDTTLSFQSQVTWQTHDTIALFDGLSEDNNGEAGEPIFVGDFNLLLDTGAWSFFYGLDVVGGTDDTEDWLNENGTLCPTYVTLGTVCVSLTTDATFYHSVSIGHDFSENFRLTAGISNLLDEKPPRVTDLAGNPDGVNQLGRGLFYSQYDLLGRRFFMNLNITY